MKKLLIVLVFVLLLVGCDRNTPVQTVPTADTTPAVTTQATTEATTVATDPVLTEAVNQVFLAAAGERMEIYAMDHRTAAVMEKFFDLGGTGKVMTKIRCVDLYTGDVLRESQMEGQWTLLPQGGCPGYVFLRDNITAEIRVLDRELQQVRTFEGVGEDGVISADLNTYYYLFGDKLFMLEGDSGISQQVQVEQMLSVREIQGYDPVKNVLFLSVFTDPYGTEYCVCAVDPVEGKIVFLNGAAGNGGIATAGYYMEQEDPLYLTGDLSYCSNDGSVFWTVQDLLANNNDYSTWHIPVSDYIYKLSYDKAQKVDVVKAELFCMGDTLQVCQLEKPLSTTKVNRSQMLSDGNLLLVSANRRGYQLYLIVPQLLTFTEAAAPEVSSVEVVNLQVLQGNGGTLAVDNLTAEYDAVRAEADRLEQLYDISILLSSQCSKLAQNETAPLVTTDVAGIPDEIGTIKKALKELEKALKLYPEGFFSQFKQDAGERGVLVMLVEDIQVGPNVIGVCYMLQNRYMVAVDITSRDLVHTYCHELWHATENKINSRMPLLLSDKVWSTCNPEGYEYSGDTSDDYINDVENTFFWESDNSKVYFIDQYGKTKPQEDRARLMEYVMAGDPYAKEICRIPALKKKLEIMADAIRQVFNTEGWETPYWERYF